MFKLPFSQYLYRESFLIIGSFKIFITSIFTSIEHLCHSLRMFKNKFTPSGSVSISISTLFPKAVFANSISK